MASFNDLPNEALHIVLKHLLVKKTTSTDPSNREHSICTLGNRQAPLEMPRCLMNVRSHDFLKYGNYSEGMFRLNEFRARTFAATPLDGQVLRVNKRCYDVGSRLLADYNPLMAINDSGHGTLAMLAYCVRRAGGWVKQCRPGSSSAKPCLTIEGSFNILPQGLLESCYQYLHKVKYMHDSSLRTIFNEANAAAQETESSVYLFRLQDARAVIDQLESFMHVGHEVGTFRISMPDANPQTPRAMSVLATCASLWTQSLFPLLHGSIAELYVGADKIERPEIYAPPDRYLAHVMTSASPAASVIQDFISRLKQYTLPTKGKKINSRSLFQRDDSSLLSSDFELDCAQIFRHIYRLRYFAHFIERPRDSAAWLAISSFCHRSEHTLEFLLGLLASKSLRSDAKAALPATFHNHFKFDGREIEEAAADLLQTGLLCPKHELGYQDISFANGEGVAGLVDQDHEYWHSEGTDALAFAFMYVHLALCAIHQRSAEKAKKFIWRALCLTRPFDAFAPYNAVDHTQNDWGRIKTWPRAKMKEVKKMKKKYMRPKQYIRNDADEVIRVSGKKRWETDVDFRLAFYEQLMDWWDVLRREKWGGQEVLKVPMLSLDGVETQQSPWSSPFEKLGRKMGE